MDWERLSLEQLCMQELCRSGRECRRAFVIAGGRLVAARLLDAARLPLGAALGAQPCAVGLLARVGQCCEFERALAVTALVKIRALHRRFRPLPRTEP